MKERRQMDLRPTRPQTEALLSEVASNQAARHKLLDAFQAHRLLSGAKMLEEVGEDGQGRYRRAYLLVALSNFDGSLRDQVIAVLEKLGAVV
jgi:hypothetical protein